MPGSTRSVRILLTASEAYPALEEAFLGARTEIWASFLVFDLSTKLRSDAAKAVGKTWFDLVVHVLNKGVAINFVISDVDPVARAAMHRAATRSLRMFQAAAAVAAPGAKLSMRRALHPAQTAAAVRLVIWPYIMKKLFRTAGWFNGQTPIARAAATRDMDGAMTNFMGGAQRRLFPRLWSLPRLHPATHHQKLAVIDRSLLYIGGLDLDERRYDTPLHGRAGDQTWHDVQLMIEGPVVSEAQAHLETFEDVIAGRVAPPPMRRLLRTMSLPVAHWRGFHFGPRPFVTEIQEAHLALAQRATKLIYLESQYFRDQALARLLAQCARRTPGLHLILILPAATDDIAFDGKRGLDARFGDAMQARALRKLRRAFGNQLFVGSPAQRKVALPNGDGDTIDRRDQLHRAPLIYVHAKVSIFDEAAAIVGSANLNGRSFRWDTEAAVYLTKLNDVQELKYRVMAHWLPPDVDPAAFEAETAVAQWRRIAQGNARRKPADRQGFLLPHDFAAAETFGRKLPIIPEEMV